MALRVTGVRRVRLAVKLVSGATAPGTAATIEWSATAEGKLLREPELRSLAVGDTLHVDYELVIDEGFTALDRWVFERSGS